MSPLELALSYAAQGFTVLPVNPATKAALTKNWTNRPDKGEPGSSKDPDQISGLVDAMAERLRRAAHRQDQRLCRRRCRSRTAIRDGFKTIKTFDGVDPKTTATVLSAGGGQHLYYAYAGELKSTTLGEGVDFLAEGQDGDRAGIGARRRQAVPVRQRPRSVRAWRRCRDRSWRS